MSNIEVDTRYFEIGIILNETKRANKLRDELIKKTEKIEEMRRRPDYLYGLIDLNNRLMESFNRLIVISEEFPSSFTPEDMVKIKEAIKSIEQTKKKLKLMIWLLRFGF